MGCEEPNSAPRFNFFSFCFARLRDSESDMLERFLSLLFLKSQSD